MADNVTTNGVTIATNDVAGVHHQKWKIVDGATGGTEAVRGTAANGLWVDVRSGVASATVAAVAASATVVTLAASNALRRALLIENKPGQTLYLKYGAGSTAALYTVSLASGGYWEMPAPIYTGIVTGIWAAADPGSVMVTEL